MHDNLSSESGGERNEDIASYFGAHRPVENPEARKLISYPWLDWLRFLLATVVFLDHSGFPLPRPVDGTLAVAVFLALSGWLIGGILMRSEPLDLPRFFYNRSTRIWAPYLVSMVMLYALGAARDGVGANWLKYLFYDATFTHITWVHFPQALLEMPLHGTGNHFWSIAVEEQFYLFAPAVILLTRWGKFPLLWVVITLALIAIQSIFAPIGAGVCVAAVAVRHPVVTSARGRWLAAAGAALALALLLHWRQQEAFVAAFGILTVVALVAPGRRSRLGVFFGAISYPFYLNHWVALLTMATLAKHAGFSYPEALAVGAITAITIATVAWWLVDRPILVHRNAWYSPARGRVCAVLAYLLVAAGLTGGGVMQFFLHI